MRSPRNNGRTGWSLRSALGGCVCALALGAGPAAAGSGIYKYTDADGVIVYTNVRPEGPGAKQARRLEGTFRPAQRPTQPARVTPQSVTKLSEYEELIESAAIRYKMPPALVRAVMHAESAFDPMAVSRVGASGLMQLMPATAEEMFVKDIFDVRQNIEGGVRYLRVLANEFDGDMVKMVAAYNAGPDAVRRYGGIPPFAETQAYVPKVIALYFQYKEQDRLQAEAKARGE